MLIQRIKDEVTCLSVAQKWSPRVWESGKDRWRFEHGSKANDFSSTYILSDKNRWGVSSLGISGDCIDLAEFLLFGTVKERQADARRAICEWRNIKQDTTDPRDEAYVNDQHLYRLLISGAKQKLQSSKSLAVLRDRGISDAVINRYNVGLVDAESYAQIPRECWQRLGLVSNNTQLLLNRIVFPVYYNGEIVNICGYDPTKGKFRYIHLAGKPQWTWNMQAGDSNPALPVWIVEGIFDALSLLSAGFPAMALLRAMPSGTPQFNTLLSELRGHPVKLALDYDKHSHTGSNATIKLLRLLIMQSTPVSVVDIMPELFDMNAGGAEASLYDGMVISEMADIFGVTQTKVKRILEENHLIQDNHRVSDCAAAVDIFLKLGWPPRKAIGTRGCLHKYLHAAKTEYGNVWPPDKIDMNDIWRITGKSVEALAALGERATLGLTTYLRNTVERTGKTEEETIGMLKEVASKFPDVDKKTMLRAVQEYGIKAQSAKEVADAPTAQSAIVAYAEALTNLVPVRWFEGYNLYTYDDKLGAWRIRDDEYYTHLLRSKVVPDHVTIADLWKRVRQEVVARHYISSYEFAEKQSRYVALRNGTLDTVTLEFIPEFSPEYYATTYMNIMYDPKADCPIFKQTLYEMFTTPQQEQDGVDTSSKVQAVREMLGLLMTRDMSFQRIWFWQGAGGNGKGMLVRLFEHILGKDNLASLSLSQLADDHIRFGLVGNRVNFGQEFDDNQGHISSNVLETLKTISGNDLITINPKYLQPFKTRLNIHLVFPVNRIPSFSQTNDAMKRRLKDSIIVFPVYFTDHEYPHGSERKIIYNLEARLIPEISGIFNWIIEGYHNLKQRGRLLPLNDSRDMYAEQMSERSTFEFLDLYVTPTNNMSDEVPLKDIMSAYHSWYNMQEYNKNNKVTSKTTFMQDVNGWIQLTQQKMGWVKRRRPGPGKISEQTILAGVKLEWRETWQR